MIKMSIQNAVSTKVLCVSAGLGITAVTALSWWYYVHKQWKKDVMPTKWKRIGNLQKINIFPVKSCRPIVNNPDVVQCEILGLRAGDCYDRGLMVIDAEGRAVTAKHYASMVQIEARLLDSVLWLTAPGMPTLMLNYDTLVENAPSTGMTVSVFGATLDVMLCGQDYDKWFSRFLLNREEGLKLVYYPYPFPLRSTYSDNMKKERNFTEADVGAFTNAAGYMLMNLASVEDLSRRAGRSIDVKQFRANFHVRTDENKPYVEDKWNWIKIGDEAVFRMVAPCISCKVQTINTETGAVDSEVEPLQTMKRYRKWKRYANPTFGIYLGLRQPGKIKEKDIVYGGA